MGFRVEVDESIFGCTGEVGVAEDGEEDCGGEGDAVVGWAAGEKARDAAADRSVGIYIIRLVSGFHVAGDAATISGSGTRSSSVPVSADATAGIGYKVIRPTIGAGDGLLARGEVCDPRVGVLLWEYNERNWYDHGRGDEENKYDTEKGKRPKRHTAASARIRFGIASCWGIRREGLIPAKSRFGQWRRPT